MELLSFFSTIPKVPLFLFLILATAIGFETIYLARRGRRKDTEEESPKKEVTAPFTPLPETPSPPIQQERESAIIPSPPQKSKKNLLLLLTSLLLLATIPAAVYLASQRQEIRKKAAPLWGCCELNCTETQPGWVECNVAVFTESPYTGCSIDFGDGRGAEGGCKTFAHNYCGRTGSFTITNYVKNGQTTICSCTRTVNVTGGEPCPTSPPEKPTPTPTKGPTPTSPPPPASCGQACEIDNDCMEGLVCMEVSDSTSGSPQWLKTCVNPACPQDKDCVCEPTTTHTPSPTGELTPTLTLTPTVTPKIECSAIKVYDETGGKELTKEEVSDLPPGTKIILAVSGEGGDFDKARFRINGGEWEEATEKNAQGEFIKLITLPPPPPSGTVVFEAMVHDSSGWH